MKNFILFVVTVTLVACAKEDDSSEGLEGSWQTECSKSSSTSSISSLSFSGGSFTGAALGYAGLTCSTPAIEMNITGSYIVGGVVKENPKSYALDLTYGPTTMKALSQAQVDHFNTNSYCGFTDWTLNVAKDVSGLTCGGSQVAAVGKKYYDIFAIYNYSLSIDDVKIHDIGDLNFGGNDATYDGSTPEKRPISLASPNYKRK
ncbi:hypothetical protein [Bdellovibrio bacteriovorus]|uniref:hypothetical protein n=1 Tax=Bdellovibrio TaxID=958 RepID=UPI0035A8B783